MLNNVRSIASCFVALSFVVAACGDGDSSDEGNGTGGGAGKGGSAGSSGSTGKGGSAGSSGSTGKGGSSGSAGNGGSAGSSGAGTGGSSAGTSGSAGAGSGGEGGDDTGSGGDAGTGNATGGAGDGGMPGTGGTGGDDGTGGAPEGGIGGEPAVGAGGAGAGEGGAPVTGSGGAGGEGGAPVAEWDTIQNPGFELWAAGEPSAGWTVVDDPDSAGTSWQGGGAHTGTGFLNLWLGSAYTADVSQVVSPIPDGTYTLSIWHWGSAYTEQYVYVSAYDESNAETRLTANTAANSAFVEIRIENIPVTSGQIKIGIYSVGAADNWSHFDDVSLTLAQ
jgi:hypothetical protein